MGRLTSRHKSFLAAEFPGHCNFDKRERRFYSHDVAAIPNLIKPLVGNTVPDGIVSETEAEQDARRSVVSPRMMPAFRGQMILATNSTSLPCGVGS